MQIEILAPAGSREALEAAVYSGADALYLGGALFSARAAAKNFSSEELAEALAFARERGVKCYITINTLVKETEMPGILRFVRFLCGLPVDALIVQDPGLFRVLRQLCPQMPLHASTQMSLHSPAGVALLEELGAARVVLARELSLPEIAEIRKATQVKLEAFVHGALCMSVSGQCYFSAMLGSRSGNRGRCAQPCRLPFRAPQGLGHDLSLKDLSFIPELSQLAEAGVDSAKIEGRMKRPEYVAAAVTAARQQVDQGTVPVELLEKLESVFSRSGFTQGYPLGLRGRDMFGIRRKEDVAVADATLFASLHALYRRDLQRVPLVLEFSLFLGEYPCLWVGDDQGNRVEVRGENPAEEAVNRPLDEERAKAQLSKLGGTPYYVREFRYKTDGECALPLSVLGVLRRRACEALGALRQKAPPISMGEYAPAFPLHKPTVLHYRAVFRSLSQVPEDLSALSWVYLPAAAPVADFVALLARGIPVGAELPRAFFGADEAATACIRRLSALGVQAFLCGNLGAVALCRRLGVPVHGGFSLNITNSESLGFFQDLGLTSAELSFELSLGEVANLAGTLPRGVMVYGRQALMLTRNCPLANAPGGCQGCKTPGVLTDRKGIQFPVMCASLPKSPGKGGEIGKCVEVFNSVPLTMSDRLHEIAGADFGVFRFTVENPVEIVEVLGSFVRQENPQYDHTRGLFYRAVQ